MTERNHPQNPQDPYVADTPPAPQTPPPIGPPAYAESAVPAAPAKPARTFGLRVLIGSTVAALVGGILMGGGFGALIGYVAHPDGPDGPDGRGGDHGQVQRHEFPDRPGFGELPEGFPGELPEQQSES